MRDLLIDVEKTKVSVIIPTYNRGNLIHKTIKSVLRQTHKNLELIIVDDGSTDNTPLLINNLKKRDSRIKYYYIENSGGPSRPKNYGIKKSVGSIIAFLDHDDIWKPNKLEMQIPLLSNSKIGLVSCDAIGIDHFRKKKKIMRTKLFNEMLPKLLFENTIQSSSSVIISRKIINIIGLFDEKLKITDDKDFWIRIARKGFQFVKVNEVLFKYDIHENNLSKKNIVNNLKELEYILEKYQNVYRIYHLYEKKKVQIAFFYFSSGYIQKSIMMIKNVMIKDFRSILYIILIRSGKFGYMLLKTLRSIINIT
ncbi:hypothetical protein NEF87_004306 [Candidatus Lokiarchaeum ossiferum]|uniref:Glycosyltransferase 2-like domain-containing protein n=1 Tax=Candidatus Lokiarchaeum ossiferum TaxID=2951803 RepID=A0ABY6HXC9_9ARCH|nr:hypothetical protein NEF87_004306 [Candidatus Lokiarchaeum sp. B-35]